MKIISIALAALVLVLLAVSLLRGAQDYRVALDVAAIIATVILIPTIVAANDAKTAPVPVAVAAPAPVPVAPPPVPQNQAEAEVVSLLATMQQKGRLVDFLMDDIAAYSDAQIGAVARVVHQGCKAVLLEQFAIVPVRTENEGTAVTVPAGYNADEYRLAGKISGRAPFSGTLMHRGWKTASVKLPRVLPRAGSELPTIAPAEVELQ